MKFELVAPEKSRAEIETTLKRYGAGGFAYASESKPTALDARASNLIVGRASAQRG